VLEVKKRTQKLRVFAAGGCLKILAPNFYEDVKDSLEAKEFPRLNDLHCCGRNLNNHITKIHLKQLIMKLKKIKRE
jgi:hypothetical protein